MEQDIEISMSKADGKALLSLIRKERPGADKLAARVANDPKVDDTMKTACREYAEGLARQEDLLHEMTRYKQPALIG